MLCMKTPDKTEFPIFIFFLFFFFFFFFFFFVLCFQRIFIILILTMIQGNLSSKKTTNEFHLKSAKACLPVARHLHYVNPF